MHLSFPLPARSDAVLLLCFLLKCSQQSPRQSWQLGQGEQQRGGTQGFASPAAPLSVLTAQGFGVFWVSQTPPGALWGSGPVGWASCFQLCFLRAVGCSKGIAGKEQAMSASTFNLHLYHCCRKDKLSLKLAGKGFTPRPSSVHLWLVFSSLLGG